MNYANELLCSTTNWDGQTLANPSIPGAVPVVVSPESVQAYPPPMPGQNPNIVNPTYDPYGNPSGIPQEYAPVNYQQYAPNTQYMPGNEQPEQYA